jgi:hypothetical protein
MIISHYQHDQVTKSEGKGNYHLFSSELSRGHVGYGKLSLIFLRLYHLVIHFPQTLSLGQVGNQ